jgi:hypothetical protein
MKLFMVFVLSSLLGVSQAEDLVGSYPDSRVLNDAIHAFSPHVSRMQHQNYRHLQDTMSFEEYCDSVLDVPADDDFFPESSCTCGINLFKCVSTLCDTSSSSPDSCIQASYAAQYDEGLNLIVIQVCINTPNTFCMTITDQEVSGCRATYMLYECAECSICTTDQGGTGFSFDCTNVPSSNARTDRCVYSSDTQSFVAAVMTSADFNTVGSGAVKFSVERFYVASMLILLTVLGAIWM